MNAADEFKQRQRAMWAAGDFPAIATRSTCAAEANDGSLGAPAEYLLSVIDVRSS